MDLELDGIPFGDKPYGEFYAWLRKHLDEGKLKFQGESFGIGMFTSDEVPPGTLQIKDSNGRIVMVVEGIGPRLL